jgi:hypothetical protein
MNVNDIHIGDILISKDGERLKITDFYPLCNDNNYRIVLSFVDAPAKDWINERVWTGRLNDLYQYFIQINDRVIDIPNTIIMEEFNTLRQEIKELKSMVKELLDK